MTIPVLSDYLTKLGQVIQDDGALLDTVARTAFVYEAVKTYSKYRPQELAEAYTGDNGYDYDLPASWEKSFSAIKGVEYPAGEQIPIFIDSSLFTVYKAETADNFRFLRHTPSTTETFNIIYTARHLLTTASTTTTIPEGDMDAVVNFAGGLCCYAMARKLAQHTDTTIQSDINNIWRSINRYREMGEELFKAFEQHMSLEKGVRPGSTSFSWFSTPSWDGDFLLTKRRP